MNIGESKGISEAWILVRPKKYCSGKSSIGDGSLAGLQTIKNRRLGERESNTVILEVEKVMTGFRSDSGDESLR